MKLTKKKGISIILIILIILTLSTVYILKSDPEKFAILDIKDIDSVNYPALKTAIEATEECNKLEEPYKEPCYGEIAESIGYYYGELYCEKLKNRFRSICYVGSGRLIGEEYPDLESVNLKCSKIKDSISCIAGASRAIGQESAKHIETEQCKKIEEEFAKRLCYEGIGRQLANDDKESKLCEKTEGKESCLIGFAHATDKKGNREEALQICQDLNDERCYFSIGFHNPSIYNKSLKESFKDCEQYPYPENCKQGVARELAFKFFKKKQQNNKTLIPVTFAFYKITDILKTKTIYHLTDYKKTTNQRLTDQRIDVAKQNYLVIGYKLYYHRIINHLTGYKPYYKRITNHLTEHKQDYLLLIFSSLGVVLISLGTVLIIRTIQNKAIQKTIKKRYVFLIKNLSKIHNKSKLIIREIIKNLSKIHNRSKLILQDILNIDQKILPSFFKELKTELKSKEGKKKLLLISGIILSTTIGNIIVADHHTTFALIFYLYRTDKNKKNEGFEP